MTYFFPVQVGLLLALLPILHAEEIIVFLVGILGWNNPELVGIPYFGFLENDFPKVVEAATGLPTIVANIGAVSSAHDRACELYAILHGITTDFGYWHAKANNHTRFGRDFSDDGPLFLSGGLGNVGIDGLINRLHLIGHSFGGNTIRYFERLLHEGLPSEEEKPYPKGGKPMSSLFESGRQAEDGAWIRSVTTLAAPHDGSTVLTRFPRSLINTIEEYGFLFVENIVPSLLYDLDIDHYKLGRMPGETRQQYLDRIKQRPLWAENYPDTAEYDLAPRAAFNFNKGGRRTYPGTYYLAFSTYQTKMETECGCSNGVGQGTDAVATSDAELFMRIPGNIIGDLSDARVVDKECFEEEIYKACDSQLDVPGPWNDKGYEGWCASNDWEMNDGVVPRRSSTGPTFGLPWESQRPKPLGMDFLPEYSCYAWTAIPDNQWYFIDVSVDHLQIISLRTSCIENVENVYGSDIASHINRIKQGGDPNLRECCIGEWCDLSSYDPPSPYPKGDPFLVQNDG